MGLSSMCLGFNISRQHIWIPKWEPRSHSVIYLVRSPFHAGSGDLVLKPATGYVSRQFHVVFSDELYKVPFIREGTIPPNWIDILQYISQSNTLENIDLKNTWFTPDLD